MDMSAFVRRFGEESAERLSDLESDISRLETSPGDRDLVNGLMRQAHTVKGGARLLRLKAIQDVAHAMEDALGSKVALLTALRRIAGGAPSGEDRSLIEATENEIVQRQAELADRRTQAQIVLGQAQGGE